MKSVGIREAKARLSELAKDAAKGEVTILTDYGKPIAMISTIEPFGRVSSFPIAIPGSPVIAFMTWCSSRRLRCIVMAC
jgi:prevent-host-death family protein